MLTVYKASAGSGKTFRLAVEYITRLIIATDDYEHTLAVTFTNKATEEMKMRILSQLYGLANNLNDSKGYLNEVLKRVNEHFVNNQKDEDYVIKRAGIALSKLLHNYSFFRVETIDKFFQKILRNLARELDLSPNLRVELSAKEIEHRAVDTWIDSLKANDKELNWILDYVQTNMDDDKQWNVIERIKTFGEQLLHDDYKVHSTELNELLDGADKNFYAHYTSSLRKIVEDANKEINNSATELWAIIKAHGMNEESFSNKNYGVGAFVRNMCTAKVSEININNTIRKACDPADTEAANWVKKKTSQDIVRVCRDILREPFIKMVNRIDVLKKMVRSAVVTLNHMSELRMLHAIQQEINRSNAEHDRFLLSDTQNLLSRMIDNSDSPFIYEKIGARLHTIMIDEFQDTSTIQWQNFKVLLNDCMSHGYDNLIVGDVKQSIYRWRSGDWRLLSNIQNDFIQGVNIKHLQINRRSSTRIIDFNNAFFTHAVDNICNNQLSQCKPEDAQMLKNAYSDVCQQYPDNAEPSGFVEVSLLEKDENYRQKTIDYVARNIVNLIEQGANPSRIAILVRTNSDISDIALYCTDLFSKSENENVRNTNIISDDGFLLKSSPAVCIIVDALRLLLNPEDIIVKARLSVMYQRYVLESESMQQEMLENMLLPEAFSQHIMEIRCMPLYQLCEHLFSIFNLSRMESQSAYLCYFFDCLNEFLANSIGDLQSFVDHWDDRMKDKSIESNSDNGVRILTIHKSKGLEFEYVFVPFCDWILEKGKLMWCSPNESPFDRLPVIPLDYSKNALIDTIYEQYYWEEHMQNMVDNINLLYVAFTRAKNGLFVTTAQGQKATMCGNIVETALNDVADEIAEKSMLVLEKDKLRFGELNINTNKKEEEKDDEEKNVFLQTPDTRNIIVKTNSVNPVFKESNRSKEFTLSEEDEQEQNKSQYIKLGNVIHNLFASMETADDMDSAILKLEMEGMLYGQDITSDGLKEYIKKGLRNPQVADWFSGRWTLHNECTILEYDAEHDVHIEHRPDRVMTDGNQTIVVDFKLYSYNSDYKDQVLRYMDLLKRMGYKNISGYLWMIMSNTVRDVY